MYEGWLCCCVSAAELCQLLTRENTEKNPVVTLPTCLVIAKYPTHAQFLPGCKYCCNSNFAVLYYINKKDLGSIFFRIGDSLQL